MIRIYQSEQDGVIRLYVPETNSQESGVGTMDKDSLKPLIETIIFAADHPISFEKLMNVLEGEKPDDMKKTLNKLTV